MASFLRSLVLAIIFLGITLSLVTSIAIAKSYHKHQTHNTSHSHKASKHKKHNVKSRGDGQLRTAQAHLNNLGYNAGKTDGLYGPKTKSAITKFQRSHKLKVTGKLDSKTYHAILEADKAPPPETTVISAAPKVYPDIATQHPDFYGHYHQDYSDPLRLNNPQVVWSRFGKIEASRDAATKNYVVTLNGQVVIQADDQPSVIGVSKTYELGYEDAIILSTYRNNNPTCSYKYYLLTLQQEKNSLQEIDNCTHGYQASVKDGSLFIVFPENESDRMVGNTWRYESNHLERL
ncbi:MAG: peptidoglycan-binding domain-containing protein [Alphaproteobacteria bacterium]